MKEFGKKLGSVLFCLIQLAIGVMLLIDPMGFTSIIIYGIGAVLAVAGLWGVIQYFRTPVEEAAKEQTLTRGLVMILLGVFCVIGNGMLIGMLPALTIFYGLLMLILGVSKIQLVVDSIRRKEKRWFLSILSAAVFIGCGCVVIMNPFATELILWKFTGIVIIVDAVLDLASFIFRNLPVKEKAEPQAPEIVEAEQ